MRTRDVQRRVPRARPGIRGFILAIAALVSVGCNTCLDASSVTLDAVPSDVGVDSPSDTSSDGADETDAADPSDAGSDVAGDTGGDACVPLSSEDLCEDLERFCGETETVDNCGERREIRCGRCDETNSECDDRGRCECDDGWRSVDDGARCVDIDECDIGADDCDDGVNCTNLPGSFQCSTCPSGYLDVNGDGSECVDIDECSNGSADCDSLVSCTNLDGSYECGSCPDGYDDVGGDGTDCQDIDECAQGIDDCDSNATCTNEAGGFDCLCDDGYVGDGKTCTVAFITKVATYRVSLSSSTQQFDTMLAESWDPSMTVPFASVRLSGQATQEDSEYRSAHPDVFLESPTVLRVMRSSPGYDVRVVVTLVEFDPATTTVQTGAYSLDAVSTDAAITAVEPSRSFAYMTTGADSTNRYDELLTRGELFATHLNLHRGDGSDRVSGHWWVVEADRQQFETQHETGTINDPDVCVTIPIAAVDTSSSALLWSADADGNSDRVDQNYVGCGFQSATSVQCCRETSGNTSLTVATQIIEFDPSMDIAVEAGASSLGATDPFGTVGLSELRGRSMPLLGSIGILGMARVDGFSARVADGMVTVDINRPLQTTEVERGSADAAAVGPWQVVHWPEAP